MGEHRIQLCFGPRDGQEFRWPALPAIWRIPESDGWYERGDDELSEGWSVRYWWNEPGSPLTARQQSVVTALNRLEASS